MKYIQQEEIKTGKSISNTVISVRIYWSQLKRQKKKKTVKPFLSDKCKTTDNIILTEKNETLNGKKKISNIFNEFFTNIAKVLNLRESTGNINFGNEESCKKIKENFGNETFSFETISKKDALDLIKELPGNKATISNDILVSVLKESVSAYYEK